jgi:hypothetical protein
MFPWFDTAKIRIIREKQGIFAEKMCSIAKLLLASKDTLLGLKGGKARNSYFEISFSYFETSVLSVHRIFAVENRRKHHAKENK